MPAKKYSSQFSVLSFQSGDRSESSADGSRNGWEISIMRRKLPQKFRTNHDGAARSWWHRHGNGFAPWLHGDDVPNDQLAKPRRILIPTDFSEASEAAVVYGSMLAEGFDAALHILHVLPEAPDEAPGLDANRWAELMEHARRSAEERLDALLPPHARAKLSVQASILFGRPVTKILEYAEDHGIDLIVIGSHGRTVMQKWWFGSVAQGVLLRAVCPVMMVRPPHQGSDRSPAALA
jgi:universal stress protein A